MISFDKDFLTLQKLYVFAGLSKKEHRGRLARGAPTVVHTGYRQQCVHSPTHILTQISSETHTRY